MRLADVFVDYERFGREPECHGQGENQRKYAIVRGGDAPVEREQLVGLSNAGAVDVNGMTILTDVTFVTKGGGSHGLVSGARRIFCEGVRAVFSKEADVEVAVLDDKLQSVRFELRLRELIDEVMRDLQEDFPQTRSIESFDRSFYMDYAFYGVQFVKSDTKTPKPESAQGGTSLKAQHESIELRNSFEACLMQDLVKKGPEEFLCRKFTEAGFPHVKITWSARPLDHKHPERLSIGVVIEKTEKAEENKVA